MGVFLYILRRLGVSILLLILASFLVYAGVRATVDPTAGFANAKDKELRVRERERLGLDRPLVTQYKEWATGVLHGDLGKGDRDKELVSVKLKRGFTNTLDLIVWGGLLAACLGISFGVIAAIKRNKPTDYTLSAFSYFGIAIPTFAFAYILLNVFAIWLPHMFGQKDPWFYTTGTTAGSFGQAASGGWSPESIVDYMRHMAMPVMVLSIQLIATWSRYQRAAMIESLQSDYIRTAHAKGMSKRRVYFRHGLRNAEVPMVTVIALDIGLLFSGLIITEYVFSIPGMGSIFLKALDNGDATTIAGWTMFTAFFVIAANFLADLLLPIIDPRIRTQ